MFTTHISRTSVAALAALAISLTSALAANLGDAASPLAIKEWIKGQPVDVKDGKNVYVVEFWATWCGPCRFTIPHLTELQKKLKSKNVVFIGISDEDAETVKPFVKAQGTNMDYTIAIDDNRKTSTNCMTAYNQQGIPTAFVIGKDAKVLWVGHPMAGLDEVLDAVLAGNYDVKTAGRRLQFRNSLQEYQQLVSWNDPTAKDIGSKLLPDAGDDVQLLTELASGLLSRTMNPDLSIADAALAKAIKLAGEKDKRVWGARADKYQYLSSKGDAQAKELGRRVLADAGDDVASVTDFAFRIVANMRNSNRDFALADEALDKAAKIAGANDARVLSVRGIARFESGKQDEGIKLARQAVTVCTNETDKPRYENFVRFMESRMKQGGDKK